ncbi:MAG: CoA transferase [Pseudomonadales bacterium]|nr:CoA transferase [Pseudomonadales bacterium]MBL6807693.1 CoA transferase [Pseudomonadales bacterium]
MTDDLPPLLEGVRILDLSAVISGPLATGLMADQGAEVWKVESLAGGDMTRALGAQHRGVTAMFATVNRNKKSIALDLKDPRGRDALLALAAQCDVFVENFRPGAAERLGLGYDAIKAVRPEVIYLSISGFGPEGPYVKRRVYDPVIQAVSGLADAQGGTEPALMRTLICDKVTALTAAQALSAALFARAQGRGGRRLSLSMLDAALYFNWSDLFWNHTFLSPEAQPHPELADTFGISRTADGHLCAIVGAGVDFSAFTTEGAMVALDEYDIPCAPSLPRHAVPLDPQVQASESLVPHQHPQAGPMRQPRPPVRDGTPVQLTPAPALGADTEAVLLAAGLSPAQVAALREAGVAA